jgi:hypothetical protein
MGEVSDLNMSALSLRDAAADSTALETFLAINPSIEFIRFQWLDYSNVLAVRVATRKFAESLASKHEPITTPSPILTALTVNGELLIEDFDIGEDEVWPDWSSLKVCHYHPGHAQAMCFVFEGGEKNGKGFRRDPRSRLLEITNTAKKEHDIDFLVGIEGNTGAVAYRPKCLVCSQSQQQVHANSRGDCECDYESWNRCQAVP